MAQYQVPQFIEVEDKIFGPLTLKQFVYLAGSGGVCLIFFTLLPLWLALPLMAPFVALGLGLAFYKVNDRPLIFVLESGFAYLTSKKLYLWKQRQLPSPQADATVKAPRGGAEAAAAASLLVPKLSQSKLKDLSWSLNIKDRNQMGVENETPSGFEI